MLLVRNLTKIYKTKGGEETKALNDVSLDFPETGMVFLLGKSGSGKSTLLNLIGGLDFPTSGEIILKGKSSKDFNQSTFDSYRNTFVGFVFQEYNILNEFNVEQNLALAMELQNKKVNKEAVNKLLSDVDLANFAKRKPNTLSGGQKQRIAIARALIKEPKIILADEPTGALDSNTGKQVFDTLKKLSSDKLIIVVSHDRDFAEIYGDRIIELADGKIISDETKFHKEPTLLSENISVVNDHAIRITDTKNLDEEEFHKLYEKIKETDGEVFITSGENATKSMRATRISPNGESEDFKKTEKIELKEYNPKDTKFIKSKMPVRKSVKMGLSSLKTKPIRLIFTLLLSIVSFTMFGVVSSLMLYDANYTYSEALKKTDFEAEKIRKYSVGTTHYESYKNGQLQNESSYDSEKNAKFGEAEIAALNNNSNNLYFVGILPNVTINTSANLQTYYEYYSQFKINTLSDGGTTALERLDYTITGTYPENDDEILLPMAYYNLAKDQNSEISSPSDAFGSSITVNVGGTTETFKLKGFFDVGAIPEKYNKLKDPTSLNEQDRVKLSEGLKNYISNSFNSVAFITKNKMTSLTKKSSYNYTYIPSYDRYGIQHSRSSEYFGTVNSDTRSSWFTEKIFNDNKSDFKLYDLNGNRVTDINLSSKQVYVHSGTYKEYFSDDLNRLKYDVQTAFENKEMFAGDVKTYLVNNQDNFDKLYNKSNNIYNCTIEELNDIYNQLLTMYNTIKIEGNKVRIIGEFLSNIMYTESYYALSEADRTLIDNYQNADTRTQESLNKAYAFIKEKYEIEFPNQILRNTFMNIAGNHEYSEIILRDSDLDYAFNNSHEPQNWFSDIVNKVKAFIEENYRKLYNRECPGVSANNLNYYEDVARTTSYKYYAKSYNSSNVIELDVIGYYEGPNNSYPIIQKSYLDSISNSVESSSYSYYETKYVEADDARYLAIMSKTTFTQDEIAVLGKVSDTYKYKMTDSVYQSTSYIASLIDSLKQAFFWIGLVMGVFAALMLLNFITVSISSKKKDIGILRAIGARKIDVFKIFYSESLFIGMVCFILATIATFVVEMFLNNYFVEKINISVLSFGVINIGLILAIALLITFISTIFPVTHASRKPPVEAIRSL